MQKLCNSRYGLRKASLRLRDGIMQRCIASMQWYGKNRIRGNGVRKHIGIIVYTKNSPVCENQEFCAAESFFTVFQYTKH